MTIRTIRTLCTALLFTALLQAQQPAANPAPQPTPHPLDVAKMLQRAATVSHEQFPEADTALVDDIVYSRYQADGTSVTWDDMAYKILTEKGKDALKTLSLHYSASYGKGAFLFIHIHKPDGKVIDLPLESLTREMINPSQMSSNIYDPNNKIITANVPDLEIGDIVRYCVCRTTFKPRCPNTFSDIYILESDEHIVNYTIIVDGPAELPLRKIAVRSPIPDTVKHTKTTQPDGRLLYRWDIQNVPVMHPEPKMPSHLTVAQRLMFSTIDTWQDVSRWYWKLCQPRLKTTPEMQAKVDELTRGLTNRIDIIRAIFKFVSQEIRYMGITIEDEAPGYEPHDVALTFNNRHGVCRDKAALLAAMLSLAKVPAFPVLIKAGDKMDPEIIQPYFNHAVTAALDEQGHYILMDSTDENTLDLFPSYLADKSYLVARENGETLLTTPFSPAADNMLTIQTQAEVDDLGTLRANAEIHFTGINDNAYRGLFANASPEDKYNFVERALKRVAPGAVIEKLDIQPQNMLDTNTPLVVRIAFSASDIFTDNDRYAMLAPPFLSTVFGMNNFILGSTQLETRKYPFVTHYACGIRENLQLSVDPVWGTPASLPQYAPISDKCVTWNRTAQLDQEHNALVVQTEFDLNVIEFSPEQYLTLKEQLKLLDDNARKLVIYRKPDPQTEPDTGNDAEIIHHTTTYHLTDATSWTSTDHVVMKILSYKGKKENAELGFDFNPAIETVKLDLAQVTTPGQTPDQQPRVQTVSDKEINLMDASWVAQAPRYPAARKLIVSLPGVEIGSVIEYKITRTQTKGTPFALRHTFRENNIPVRHRTLTVNAPAQLKLATAVFQNGILANTFKVHQNNITETFVSENNRSLWTWTATDQPAIPDDPYQPNDFAFTPAVFASATNWQALTATIGKAFQQAADTASPQTAAAAETIRQLPENQRLNAVNTLLARNVKEAGPSFLSLPLSCLSAPDTTLQDGYGNDADQAILAFALLKHLGYAPEFLFISYDSTTPALFQQLYAYPNPWMFDHVLIRVNHDGQTYWFNDQNQYANIQTTTAEHCHALTLDGTLFTVDVPEIYRAHQTIHYTIVLDDDGNATLTVSEPSHGPSFGHLNQLYSEFTPEYRHRQHLKIMKQFSPRATAASPLVTDFSTYPGTHTFSCKIPQFATRDGDFIYFKLPAEGFKNLPRKFNAKRTTPLARFNYSEINRVYQLTLPPSFRKVVMAPQNWEWKAPVGDSRYAITTVQAADGTLTFTYQAHIEPVIVFPENFEKYTQLANTLSRNATNTILLSR